MYECLFCLPVDLMPARKWSVKLLNRNRRMCVMNISKPYNMNESLRNM